MVTEKEFLAETKCFSENIENMFCTSDYQKLYAKNTISLKRYHILKIVYLIETFVFGLNVAYSNCNNLLGESAIGISFFKERLYGHFQRVISPLLIRIFENGFHCMKGYIF